VKIYVDGELYATRNADADGNWEYRFTQPLAEGEHTITVTSVVNSRESAPSVPFKIVVDTTPPAAAQDVTLFEHDTGNVIANGTSTATTAPIFRGKAAPGSTVLIHEEWLNGANWQKKLLGSTQANADGTWTFRPGYPLQGSFDASRATVYGRRCETAQATPARRVL
jgi:hypothetical protein